IGECRGDFLPCWYYSFFRLALYFVSLGHPRFWNRHAVWRTCIPRRLGDAGLGGHEGNRMTTREKILVAGAGISGLGVALALGGGAREVTILDRDPPPPDAS